MLTTLADPGLAWRKACGQHAPALSMSIIMTFFILVVVHDYGRRPVYSLHPSNTHCAHALWLMPTFQIHETTHTLEGAGWLLTSCSLGSEVHSAFVIHFPVILSSPGHVHARVDLPRSRPRQANSPAPAPRHDLPRAGVDASTSVCMCMY